MRAILVDDEHLALQYLGKLLQEIDGVKIIGTYINPYEAIEAILQEKPDIVFLDIEMPEMNGIELAEKIQETLPTTHIVFITAFSEYAVKAFEINAVDYIVKPVQRDRLSKTLWRIAKEFTEISNSTVPSRSARVSMFQSLSFVWSGDVSEPIDVRWRTSKVRGIFALLLQNRGTFVQKDLLLDLFWPEMDLEKGFIQLYSAVYQIRKTIASTNFDMSIVNHENGYRLDLNGVTVDVDEWEKGIEQVAAITDKTLEEHRKLLELYQGDYLAKEEYVWAEGERERLRVLWLQHIFKVADYLVSDRQFGEAVSLYLRVQIAQPFLDESYFKLMQLYGQLGDHRSVEQQYSQLTAMLQEEYDAKPRAIIREWYEKWLGASGISIS
ncbi:response regulator [Sporosarcina sp. FSL K6-3457]|uniref:response regulator n=1 Tax=Sporosarcina sp. FSL K6-3457 TaxID=2978204 RepID=UPI0030FA00FC